jgi:hypothetical protein
MSGLAADAKSARLTQNGHWATQWILGGSNRAPPLAMVHPTWP